MIALVQPRYHEKVVKVSGSYIKHLNTLRLDSARSKKSLAYVLQLVCPWNEQIQREISSSSYVSTGFSHTSADLVVILDFVVKFALFGTKFAADD